MESSLNTFEEMNQSKFQPYANVAIFNFSLSNDDNQNIESIKAKTILITKDLNCMLELRRTKKAFCIMLDVKAYYEIKSCLDSDGNPVARLARYYS